MLRTLALAGLVTLFGAAASEAQYRDSYPPDEQYSERDDDYYDDDYDYELLGDPDEYGYNEPDGYGYNEPDIDVGIFASLGHNGRWHLAANLGWVWRPYAATGWRPYSAGHWVWTSYGWTWVSYEPYGWATYHYGYWASDPFLGWVWIPGYEWSACRVQWAYYDNYVSWAPLAPPGYYCPRPYTTAGFSFWITIGASNFCDPYPIRHCVTPVYTSGYKERVKYKSPDRGYVERYSGRSIRTTSVEFKHKSWSRGESTSAKFTSKSRGGSNSAKFTSKSNGGSNSAKFTSKSNGGSKSAKFTTKSRVNKPEVRALNQAKNSGRSENRALKSKSQSAPSRQFQARESQRVSSGRKAVKPQRATRESNFARAERPSKQFAKSGKSVSRESRVARAERPSKQSFNGNRSTREQRSIQKPSREQRQSKASFQTARGSGERKSMTSGNKSERREVATKGKKSGSGKGRGKAR
jgi:hypothetical protein